MNLCDYNTIRDLLARHGFHFSKSMGQNFLIDPEVPRRIAEASGADAGCGVLEIGPGIGPLTAELAQRAGKVVAVELDRALLPVLAETMAPYPNVEVVPGDVLKLDLTAIAAEKFQGLTPIVCANLPYNVTSPILEKLVESPCFTAFTVMIQREVARRLCAPQGSSEGGSFSLFLQYYMKPELLFDVPPEKFLPAPKVTFTIGIIGSIYAIYTISDYILFTLAWLAVVVIFIIVWNKAHKKPINEVTKLEDAVIMIRERTEYLPVWDEAVVDWLKSRNAL